MLQGLMNPAIGHHRPAAPFPTPCTSTMITLCHVRSLYMYVNLFMSASSRDGATSGYNNAASTPGSTLSLSFTVLPREGAAGYTYVLDSY